MKLNLFIKTEMRRYMNTQKPFWYTVLGLFLAGLVLAGAGFGKASGTVTERTPETIEQLDGKKLGGVTGKMTETHLKLLWETILGIKLQGYESYATMDELLFALKDGRVDAMWCPDITAKYLTAQDETLYELEQPEATNDRFSFAMAFRPEDEAVCTAVSEAIAALEQNGTLAGLVQAYVEAESPITRYEKEMSKQNGDHIYVGVTGTVPPIDRFDKTGKPCGFSAALLDEIGKCTGYRFVLVPIDAKNAFTCLENGKIDAIFGYGMSKNTTPSRNDVVTTMGYYGMNQYSYVTLKKEVVNRN